MQPFSQRYWPLPGLLLLCLSTLTAQRQAGWALDPHAGISAAYLQPAATTTTPYDWDLTLGGLSASVSNNFTFLRQASGWQLLTGAGSTNNIDIDDGELTLAIGEATYDYDFPQPGEPIFGRLGVSVDGPAFSVQAGEYTRIGAFTRLRALASTRKLDADFNYYPYNERPNGVDLPVEGQPTAGAAAWAEVGIHLARAFPVGNDAELRLGLSPRYLIPLEGVFATNEVGSSLRQFSGDSIIVNNGQTTLGLSAGLRGDADPGQVAGSGFAVDLGVQYAWGETGATGYRYTLGLSLLDLGSLNFSQGGREYLFANDGPVLLLDEDYSFSGIDSVDIVLTRLSQDVNGTDDAQVGNAFSMALPATISAQFLYRPLPDIQLGVVYRGNFPGTDGPLSHGDYLTATAHYSRWWYGGGLTVGYHDWRQFNVGFQIRLGPVYLGTDQLIGSVLPTRELDSGSFYFGLRLHDFTQGRKSGAGRSGGGRKKGSKQVGCYQF
jgi:hypothetical protein